MTHTASTAKRKTTLHEAMYVKAADCIGKQLPTDALVGAMKELLLGAVSKMDTRNLDAATFQRRLQYALGHRGAAMLMSSNEVAAMDRFNATICDESSS